MRWHVPLALLLLLLGSEASFLFLLLPTSELVALVLAVVEFLVSAVLGWVAGEWPGSANLK